MTRKIPTNREIIEAAAKQGITIPKKHVVLDMIQNAYRKVDERGGIDKIAEDIKARIEAARERLASQ